MNLKQYLTKAKKEGWGIGQFNFSTLEQLRAILEAAKETKSPVILGTSEGESKFLGLAEIMALFEITKSKYKINAFINLDHGKSFDWLKKAIDIGYDAVHFDGCELPLEKNIKQTKKIVQYAHKKGVWVEGELGKIKGESKLHESGFALEKEDFTSPDEVAKFIKETGVDSLAVSVGTIHGIYREATKKIDFERLKEINKISKVPLVLHGGSGVLDEEIKKAILFGITKINFNTEIRLAWKSGLDEYFKNNPTELKPYKILEAVQKTIQKKIEEKINLLNCKGKL